MNRFMLPALVNGALTDLDGGRIFQRAYAFLLRLTCVAVALASLVFFWVRTFGKESWFDGFTMLTTWTKIRSVVGAPLMLAVSLLIPVVVILILLRRARELKAAPYSGLVAIWLRLIKVMGEVLVVAPIVASVVQLLATLLQLRPYNPFFFDWSRQLGPLRDLWDAFSQIMSDLGFAGYGEMTVSRYLQAAAGSVVGVLVVTVWCFGILVLFYLVAELGEIVYYFLLRKPAFQEQARAHAPEE